MSVLGAGGDPRLGGGDEPRRRLLDAYRPSPPRWTRKSPELEEIGDALEEDYLDVR